MLNIDDRLIKEVAPKIKPNALAVLLAIAIHLGKGKNTAFPSHRRLMMLTGLGRDAVYKALETLKSSGLLTAFQSKSVESKQFGKRVFKVTTKFISIFVTSDEADPLPENPDTAFPDTAFPDTANQEAKQLNEVEQLNQFELLNEVEAPAPAQLSGNSEQFELSSNPLHLEGEKEKPIKSENKTPTIQLHEPREILLSWATGDGSETVKVWYERATRKFSPQDLESLTDDFLSVYGTSSDAGVRVQVEQDPLKFFKGRFQYFLKNQRRFDAAPGPSTQKATRSTLSQTGQIDYDRPQMF